MKVSELRTILNHLAENIEIKTEVLVDLGESQLSFKTPLIKGWYLDINGELVLELTNIFKYDMIL